jgi:16S rRNA (guanine(966)-N(2))-methyltransferase RsmD
MRIISGKYKGRQLTSAKDQSIRPTTNKIKEYIFEILSDFIPDVTVLDLFSGTGNLGFEALSRGALNVTFVDVDQNSLRVLRRNLNNLKIEEPVKIIRKDAIQFLKTNRHPFELIFADPPYMWKHFDQLVPLVFKKNNLTETGLFVLECDKSAEVPWESESWELLRQKQFDRTFISFFARKGII